jgi:2-iminobutanoate/2-iminopropanoate deaminase
MKRETIDTDKTAKVIGPYSKAVKVIDPKAFIFVSGHVAQTKEGAILRGDIKAQTKQTFENIKHVLEAGGATLKDVVHMTVFLKDMKDYSGFNEIRKQYFDDTYPASSAFVVKDFVAEGLLVEIEAIAAL